MQTQIGMTASDAQSIVDSCGSQPVCLYDGASISDSGGLASMLPEGVRVVVIPEPDQAQSISSSALAADIRSSTGADTVIVIEDRATDRVFVASNRDATEIATAINSQNQADGGAAVAAIASSLEAPAPQEAPAVGGGVILGLVGAVLVAGVIFGSVALIVRRRRRRGQQAVVRSKRLERELEAALNGPDGEFVVEAIERLEGRAARYPDLGARLTALADHVSELFVRARKRGTDQQLRLLQAQYKDTLGKLLKALDDDYYGDILANPQFWSGTEERLAEVRRAVESVDQQAIENIKQVNESRDLEFKVALDSLNRTVAEAKLSDVYTDRENP